MTLNRRILRNVDDRLRSELDRDKGEWMVKVPVSNATRAVWRRYCDAVGVHMGEALAILLHHELASIVDVDLERFRDRLEQREIEIETRTAELSDREGEVERREGEVDLKSRRSPGESSDLRIEKKNSTHGNKPSTSARTT